MVKACSIDGCEKGGRLVRGWCVSHYRKWAKYGDPLAGGTWYATPEEAFDARTEPLCWTGCIVWTGALYPNGYGHLSVNGRSARAHRYAWERERGQIPDGAVLDHICHVRSCVNVDHLRIATRQQNNANRSGATRDRDLPRGVQRHRHKYVASVHHGGKHHYLGLFDTPEEASAAAAAKRAEMFGEFAGRA